MIIELGQKEFKVIKGSQIRLLKMCNPVYDITNKFLFSCNFNGLQYQSLHRTHTYSQASSAQPCVLNLNESCLF